jgi:hypothetical protein
MSLSYFNLRQFNLYYPKIHKFFVFIASIQQGDHPMPAVTQYDPQNKALRQLADDELSQRRAYINRIRAYYEGEHPHQLADGADNIVLNLCQQVINETTAFLIPKMPIFELNNNQAQMSEREAWLADVWEANGGASLVHGLALNGALAGHVFARVVPPTDPQGHPRIVPLNPANVIVWWRADDYQTVLAYEIRWEAPDGRYRQDVYKEETGWIVRDYTQPHAKSSRRMSASAEWSLVTEAHYATCPIVSWGHLSAPNVHYGRDELGGLVALNLHINKVASDIKSILRYHAYPTTVGTGFSAKDVQETRIDGFLTIPDKDARVFNVEMQSELTSSLALLERLENHFLGIARVVMVRGGVDAFRGMTNLGVRTAFLPMIMKNEQLRRAYGTGLREISRRVLAYCPHSPADPNGYEAIGVHWGDALPTDRADEVAVVLQELNAEIINLDTAKNRLMVR